MFPYPSHQLHPASGAAPRLTVDVVLPLLTVYAPTGSGGVVQVTRVGTAPAVQVPPPSPLRVTQWDGDNVISFP